MAGLARLVMRRRRLVIAVWVALTILGAYSAKAVSSRWLEQFSIPGYSAYEANQRALKIFGSGEQPPHVALFTAKGDVTKKTQIATALAEVRRDFPGFRTSSYFS